MRHRLFAAAALAAGSAVPAAQAAGTCGLDYLCAAPGIAAAGPANVETAVTVGVQWNFADFNPELVVGLRRTRTNPAGTVIGAKADVAVPVSLLNFYKPTFRVMGIAGGEYVQGEAGVGFKAVDWRPVLAVGAQGPFVNAGLNWEVGGWVKPYAGVNSQYRTHRPGSGGANCAAGYALVSPVSLSLSGAPTVGGKTCAKLVP